MTYDEYLLKCSESYYDFIELITTELESLNEMLNNNNSIKQKALDFNNIISSKEKLLENKDRILELNIELKDYFDLIEFLNSKNNLDNVAADEAYNAIINDKYIINEGTIPDGLNDRIKEIESEINKIKKIIDNNYDYKSITELIDYYGFDEEAKSRILFGFILKEINLLIKRNNIEIKKEIKEEIEEKNKSKFIQVDNKKVDEELLEKYNDSLKKYKEIQVKYNDLIDEYYKKYESNYSKKVFDGYANQDINYIYNNLELSEEELSFVLYKKVINEIGNANESISQIDESNPTVVDYETAIFYINEFESVLNEFIKVVEHLNDKKINESDDSSKVYFIHDEKNNILTPNIRKHIKKIQSFIVKSDIGALDSRNLKVYRLIGAENEEKYLSKMIFLLNSNIGVTYVKLSDGGTLVLCVDNIDNILESTKEIIKLNGVDIRKTIELIESQDLNELNSQKQIRKDVNSINPEDMIL